MLGDSIITIGPVSCLERCKSIFDLDKISGIFSFSIWPKKWIFLSKDLSLMSVIILS